MNEQQFNILIQELQIIKNDITEKLEEIRCGIIDVETEVQKLSEPENEQVTQPDRANRTTG